MLLDQAIRLEDRDGDYDPLLELIGDADVVLLGEATHGSTEFYRERARITRRLIREKGFGAIAVEADWPDAYRVNRFVQGAGRDSTAREALSGFRRFPAWMWRNTEVLELVSWLRAHNQGLRPGAPRVGFYGLDLYSLFTSIEAVLRYLSRVDPAAADLARARYACFDHFNRDPQAYGQAVTSNQSPSCEEEVVRQLTDLLRNSTSYLRGAATSSVDDYFFAQQNARLARNAERYYRAMYAGRVASWNLRDQHMAETIGALMVYLGRQARRPRLVVWEHNSHVGDARATELGEAGELSVGQLVRQSYGGRAVLVGFSTYDGTVTAAREWNGPAEVRQVRPALPNSYEALFHGLGEPRFMLRLRGGPAAAEVKRPCLERAIGVIYRPESERASHYFRADLSRQFDALIHLDHTTAVTPLTASRTVEAEPPETYPTGI